MNDVLREIILGVAATLDPGAGRIARIASRLPTGEARTKAVIEAQSRRDLEELYVLVHEMHRRLTDVESQTAAEEIAIDPQRLQRAAEEFAEQSAGVAPEKKRALRNLTVRRFDPRYRPDIRDYWFELASRLRDHDVWALIVLKGRVISVLDGVVESDPPLDSETLSGEAGIIVPSVLDALSRVHPDVVRNEFPDRSRKARFRLTPKGEAFVSAMQEYEHAAERDPSADGGGRQE